MILLLDVNNSSTSLKVYADSRKEVASYKTYSDKLRSAEEYASLFQSFFSFRHLTKEDFTGAILSCVVPSLSKRIAKAIAMVLSRECLVLSRSLKTGLALRMDNPSEVGSDLIAACVGASSNYHSACLVIMMNSVLSFSLVSAKKEFLGGALFPGLRASGDFMANHNAQLLDIQLDRPRRYLGKSTKECMNNGLIYGYRDLIVAYADQLEKEVSFPFQKVLTGSDSSLVKDFLPLDYHYAPNVLYDGLYDIYQKNRGK